MFYIARGGAEAQSWHSVMCFSLLQTTPKCEETELRRVLSKYGKIRHAEQRGDSWKVIMETAEEAVLTKLHLHTRYVDGMQLLIEYALEKQE